MLFLLLMSVSVKVKLLSHVRLFVTPWTTAYQVPPSVGFSRQEYWSGLPFPSPGDLPNPGIEPRSPALQADALPSEPPGKSISRYMPLVIHGVCAFYHSECYSSTFGPKQANLFIKYLTKETEICSTARGQTGWAIEKWFCTVHNRGSKAFPKLIFTQLCRTLAQVSFDWTVVHKQSDQPSQFAWD